MAANTKAGAGRLVHLPEHQRRVGKHAGIAHLQVQLVGLTRPLADSCEYGDAVMFAHRALHQLDDQDSLADTRASEQAGFAPLRQRYQQVQRLDASDEQFRAFADLSSESVHRGRIAAQPPSDSHRCPRDHPGSIQDTTKGRGAHWGR